MSAETGGSFSLTPEEIDSYHADGFLIRPSILSESAVKE